jgi:hypothetical protein
MILAHLLCATGTVEWRCGVNEILGWPGLQRVTRVPSGLSQPRSRSVPALRQ